MKTKLLFTKQLSYTLVALLAFSLCCNYGYSQNLMQNPTCDTHGTGSGSTSDNADSYDMTPNNTIKDETGADIPSPYQAVWDNDDLEDWLEVEYLGMAGSLDEQPGSTSSGNNGTRGVKLYDDGNPVITGCSRRIYQKVEGLTIGEDYTFSVESRSEAMGTPSEVYLLNTEIADELGINANGGTDASVDGFTTITTDYDAWTTTTVNFTATNTFAVVYIRSLSSVDGATEVFYDNFSLVEATAASTNDLFASSLKVYPNPAKDSFTIDSNNLKISSVVIYNVLGNKVYKTNTYDRPINVSKLTSGLYLVEITSNEQSTIKKLIIK